jgi:hypothetical protein
MDDIQYNPRIDDDYARELILEINFNGAGHSLSLLVERGSRAQSHIQHTQDL